VATACSNDATLEHWDFRHFNLRLNVDEFCDAKYCGEMDRREPSAWVGEEVGTCLRKPASKVQTSRSPTRI
jgi:hypothetical protein